MTRTLTLEGNVTAVNTSTALNTQGTVSSPNQNVPKGLNRISAIHANVAVDAGAEGVCVFLLTFRGAGMTEESIIFAGASALNPQSGSDTSPLVMNSAQMDVDIDVSESDQIEVNAEMLGSDIGSTTICCTLVFAE